MQIVYFIPALLFFLYILYRFVKDDYVFIRKGISVEQAFDIAFITLWGSLFFSRLLFLCFHFSIGENLFLDFFSTKKGGFSLTGAVVGGVLTMYLIGRYRRIPLGRLSDFLCLAFLYVMPVLFLLESLLVAKKELLFIFLNAIIYFVVLLFFAQFLYPKILNRTLKEGMVAILFLFIYSIISLATNVLLALPKIQNAINPENSTLLLFFVFTLGLLIKQSRQFHTRRVIK